MEDLLPKSIAIRHSIRRHAPGKYVKQSIQARSSNTGGIRFLYLSIFLLLSYILPYPIFYPISIYLSSVNLSCRRESIYDFHLSIFPSESSHDPGLRVIPLDCRLQHQLFFFGPRLVSNPLLHPKIFEMKNGD